MAADEAADDGRLDSAGARWALALTAGVGWFLIEALWRIVVAANTAVALVADGGRGEVFGVIARLLPLVALLTPAIPLSGFLDRDRLATRAALLALGAGIAQAAVSGVWRTAVAMLAFTGGAWFLVAIVGVANRRAVAAGFAGAFLLRELAQVAGVPSDIPDRSALIVAVVVASLALLALRRWMRAPHEERGDSYERRAGGLRLRGALALGAILFFELTMGIGVRTGASPVAAAASMLAAVVAWLVIVRGLDVPRHRLLAVTLAAVAGLCALTFLVGSPRDRAIMITGIVGHAATLLLLDRALAPVSGRRSGGNLSAGLLLLGALTLVRAAIWSFAPARTPTLWLAALPVLAAAIVLGVAMYLTPRPSHAKPALPDSIAFGIAVALPVVAAFLAAR